MKAILIFIIFFSTVIRSNSQVNNLDSIKANPFAYSQTKKDSLPNIKICTPERKAFIKSQPLVLVNGQQKSYSFMNKLNPDSIKSINIISAKDAQIKYGKKAENGVIAITMK